MKNVFIIIYALFLIFLQPTNLLSNEYKIDKDHSFIYFKIKHFSIGYIVGRFNNFSGLINFFNNLSESSVSTTIYPISIDTGVLKRDHHLRTEEFLDVLKYPLITFKSIDITDLDKNKNFTIKGKLKILDVEKKITLNAKYLGETVDPENNKRIAFKGKTALNRHDFNINFNKKLKNNKPMIGDNVYVHIYIEATKVDKDE